MQVRLFREKFVFFGLPNDPASAEYRSFIASCKNSLEGNTSFTDVYTEVYIARSDKLSDILPSTFHLDESLASSSIFDIIDNFFTSVVENQVPKVNIYFPSSYWDINADLRTNKVVKEQYKELFALPRSFWLIALQTPSAITDTISEAEKFRGYPTLLMYKQVDFGTRLKAWVLMQKMYATASWWVFAMMLFHGHSANPSRSWEDPVLKYEDVCQALGRDPVKDVPVDLRSGVYWENTYMKVARANNRLPSGAKGQQEERKQQKKLEEQEEPAEPSGSDKKKAEDKKFNPEEFAVIVTWHWLRHFYVGYTQTLSDAMTYGFPKDVQDSVIIPGWRVFGNNVKQLFGNEKEDASRYMDAVKNEDSPRACMTFLEHCLGSGPLMTAAAHQYWGSVEEAIKRKCLSTTERRARAAAVGTMLPTHYLKCAHYAEHAIEPPPFPEHMSLGIVGQMWLQFLIRVFPTLSSFSARTSASDIRSALRKAFCMFVACVRIAASYDQRCNFPEESKNNLFGKQAYDQGRMQVWITAEEERYGPGRDEDIQAMLPTTDLSYYPLFDRCTANQKAALESSINMIGEAASTRWRVFEEYVPPFLAVYSKISRDTLVLHDLFNPLTKMYMSFGEAMVQDGGFTPTPFPFKVPEPRHQHTAVVQDVLNPPEDFNGPTILQDPMMGLARTANLILVHPPFGMSGKDTAQAIKNVRAAFCPGGAVRIALVCSGARAMGDSVAEVTKVSHD